MAASWAPNPPPNALEIKILVQLSQLWWFLPGNFPLKLITNEKKGDWPGTKLTNFWMIQTAMEKVILNWHIYVPWSNLRWRSKVLWTAMAAVFCPPFLDWLFFQCWKIETGHWGLNDWTSAMCSSLAANSLNRKSSETSLKSMVAISNMLLLSAWKSHVVHPKPY